MIYDKGNAIWHICLLGRLPHRLIFSQTKTQIELFRWTQILPCHFDIKIPRWLAISRGNHWRATICKPAVTHRQVVCAYKGKSLLTRDNNWSNRLFFRITISNIAGLIISTFLDWPLIIFNRFKQMGSQRCLTELCGGPPFLLRTHTHLQPSFRYIFCPINYTVYNY